MNACNGISDYWIRRSHVTDVKVRWHWISFGRSRTVLFGRAGFDFAVCGAPFHWVTGGKEVPRER